jgi:hypothetical protein
MKPHQFTPKAAKFWNAIPVEFQQKILEKVFCSKCGVGVRIINYTGAIKDGDLLLRGNCAVCEHEVVRLLEGPES